MDDRALALLITGSIAAGKTAVAQEVVAAAADFALERRGDRPRLARLVDRRD